MKKHNALVLITFAVGLLFSAAAFAQDKLPARLADDPVAKALGPAVINAALKEGKVVWYGGTTSQQFFDSGAKDRFEKRFGIRIELISGRMRHLTDRIRTEVAVGKVQGDIMEGGDKYMLELHAVDALAKWRPPAPELDNIDKKVFVSEPVGYWWPVHLSAQAILLNTNMVKPEDYPKSYWDIVDPKWKGRVAIRDPRASGGGAWHMLGIYNTPGMGIDYIKKLKATVEPFIVRGGSRKLRDAIARGQFALGFSGRGENIRDLPKGTPVKFVVPKEGQAWTPFSMATIKGAGRPNAAKVIMTWFYELENLQAWNTHAGRNVPHPKVKPPIPEMSLTAYPLMRKIPSEQLGDPNFFFKEMEQVFGIR